MKENYIKINKDLKEISKNFDWLDMVNMAEISRILDHKDLGNLQLLYNNELVNDGINTFGLFYMILTDKYKKSKYNDLYNFIHYELEDTICEFMNKYVEIEEYSITEYCNKMIKKYEKLFILNFDNIKTIEDLKDYADKKNIWYYDITDEIPIEENIVLVKDEFGNKTYFELEITEIW